MLRKFSFVNSIEQVAEKESECFENLMLRQAQQLRKSFNEPNTHPFTLSPVKNSYRSFSSLLGDLSRE